MTKAKTATPDYLAQFKDGLADFQAQGRTAYDKAAQFAAEMHELSKEKLAAFVESGKILSTGLQDIAKLAAEDGRAAVESATVDAKEFAAVRSPVEFVELQGKIVSRNFDVAAAQLSKATEAWVKLAGDVTAPLSSRVSITMEKVREAA